MKTSYSLLKIALLVIVGCGFLLPRSGWAVGGSCLGLGSGGTFSLNAGFWQAANPLLHGPAALTITPTGGNAWTGLLTIQDITYSVTGKTDASGNVKFSSGRTGVKGTGKLQDLTRGGVLLMGTYSLSSTDYGEILLLQNFSQPPDPPDIDGSWLGTFENVLCLMTGTFDWLVHQDRTPKGTPGTGFTGQETIDTIICDFVGTIDAEGNFVRIGVSDEGFLIEGGKIESGQLTAHSCRKSVGGGNNNDLVLVGTFYPD